MFRSNNPFDSEDVALIHAICKTSPADEKDFEKKTNELDKILKKNPQIIEALCPNGFTPFLTAVANENPQIAWYLVGKKARLDAQVNNNYATYYIALWEKIEIDWKLNDKVLDYIYKAVRQKDNAPLPSKPEPIEAKEDIERSTVSLSR